jgi:OOP family OmpA-OmpF porin
MILSADTYFDFDKATLKREGEVKVDEVVRAMKAEPKLRATVDGYTDSIGTEAYNQRLSERRANAVRSYMVSQGIDASRITARGYGESHPVADNKTAEGRAKNRRVEITTE